MIQITKEQLKKILQRVSEERLTALTDSLNATFEKYEINTRLRQAHFLGQVLHESGGFNFGKEIWGNTPAQVGYDTRTDLGNTPDKDGDGKKYMGRGYIQITGKANYEAVSKEFGVDFLEKPELLEKAPWNMYAAGWFWKTKKLNQWADQDNVTVITKKINGGLNGLSSRIVWTAKVKSIFKI
jgi:putative chitinase